MLRKYYLIYRFFIPFLLVCLVSNVFAMAECSSAPENHIVISGKSGYEYIEFDKRCFQEKLQERRASGIDEKAIQNAKRLQYQFGVFPKPTPLYTNDKINAFVKKLLGHDITVYLKDETVNPTGSFKDRMPIRFYRKVAQDIISAKKMPNKHSRYILKVMAVSTGNHGRAVAYAANNANGLIQAQDLQNYFHLYSEITMSSDALLHKKRAISALGAHIRDRIPDSTVTEAQWKPIPSYDEAENLVVSEAKADPEHTLLLFHADKDAINGYAVIADEVIQQARDYGVLLNKINYGEALMLVPLGSGGILSGIEEISARFPQIFSIGVTASPADLTYRSLKSGKLVRSAEPYHGKLIVDGVMATPEPFSLKRINEVATEVLLVQQEDAVYATALLKKNGIVIEPTSGLPLAGLLLGTSKNYEHAHYAFIVLTGKNIAEDMQDRISKLAEQDEKIIFDYFKMRRSAIQKALRNKAF